jgi:hypothetical protein
MLPGYGQDHHNFNSSLGQEYLLDDDGSLSPAFGVSGHPASHPAPPPAKTKTPSPTLVKISGSNLEIDLVWDSSVGSAPSGFTTAIIDAAKTIIAEYGVIPDVSGAVIVNLKVGYGEIGGSAMSANALGESESYGYLTNYSTVTGALTKAGYSFTASNEPTSAQFFVTSAEAKAMGLVKPTSSATDGFVGFSTLSGTGYSWNLTAQVGATDSGTGANQFDLEAVASHEISEVLGRIGMEGATMNGATTYTPLDLFDFSSAGVLALAGNGGYFSIDNGATNLGTFNNANAYGGDVSDWASATSISQSHTLGLLTGYQDAYDAFGFPGVNGQVTSADFAAIAALGYGSHSKAVAIV